MLLAIDEQKSTTDQHMAIECTYCEEKINAKRGLYVKCDQCEDINLCLECFSSGAELGDHRSDHSYELIDCGSFPIIDNEWKAHEELALLEAIELYGIGNWSEISNKVITKTPQECMQRYMSIYVDDYLGQATWQSVDKDAYKVYDHTCSAHGPLSPSLSAPTPQKLQQIAGISRDQQLKLGYMPKRDDFEKEFDNDAELLVSKLAVNANDDTDLDQALKVAHINMYTDRLRERYRRKRVVFEYNLVNEFFQMTSSASSTSDPSSTSTTKIFSTATSTTLTKTNQNYCRCGPANTLIHHHNNCPSQQFPSTINQVQCEPAPTSSSLLSSYFDDLERTRAEEDMNQLEEKLRVFCQFVPAKTYQQLLKNLAGEKELKIKIKELMKLRKNGVTKLNTSSGSADSCADSTASSSSKSSPMPKIVGNHTSMNQDGKGSSHVSHVDDDNYFTCMILDEDTDSRPSSNNNVEDPSPRQNCSKTNVTTNHSKKRNHHATSKISNNNNVKTSNRNHANSGDQHNQVVRNQNPLPCCTILSESEKRLCKSMNLKPSNYISYKTLILTEQKKKKGSPQKSSVENIDKNVRKKIVDFLARNNWLKV